MFKFPMNLNYPRREDNAGGDIALALLGVRLVEADHLLHGEDAERADEPLPEVGSVQNAEQPKRKITEVSPVEHLHNKTAHQTSLTTKLLKTYEKELVQTSKLPDSRTQRILHST